MIKCDSQENHLNISQGIFFHRNMASIFDAQMPHGNKWMDYSLVTKCSSYLCLFFQMEHLIWASTYNSSIGQHLMLSLLGISFGHPIGDGLMLHFHIWYECRCLQMLKVCESICHTHLDYDSSNLWMISKKEHSYNAIKYALFHDISGVYLLRWAACFVLIISAFEWYSVRYSKIYHGINTKSSLLLGI